MMCSLSWKNLSEGVLQWWMHGMVILVHIGIQAFSQFLKTIEIFHVQCCHPVILHVSEPLFDFTLRCRSIGSAIVKAYAKSGSQQTHLFILIWWAIVKVEDLWFPIGCDRIAHDTHQIDKIVIHEDVDTGDHSAGIVQQCDDIGTFLFAIDLQIRAYTGIAAPHFIDILPLISPHIFVSNILLFIIETFYIVIHTAQWQLLLCDDTMIEKFFINECCGDPWILLFIILYLFHDVLIQFPWLSCITPAFRHERFKSVFLVIVIPSFDRSIWKSDRSSSGIQIAFCGSTLKKFVLEKSCGSMSDIRGAMMV